MAIPEGMTRFIPPAPEEIQNFISSSANRSVRPYNTNEEYLYAMKEDLAEWLKELYQVNIYVDNFMDFLQDGILLCEHANRVNDQAKEFKLSHAGDPILKKIILPSKMVRYTPGRHASTFFARDNVANFIDWCRKELLISEAVMFESNDLILKMNEKNFILCLLEMARRGSKFGVPAPVLIQMEEEIDEEIEQDLREEQQQDQSDEEEEEEEEVEPPPVRAPPKQKVACDFKSLDEMVQYILGMCSCPTQFPMVKVSEGKYKVGDSKTLIFMRILRNHVMVRVGGGWDTLEHYLDKHDPCRCNRHRVEQKIATRTSHVGPGISVKQTADAMNRTGPSTRDSKDWNNIRSQSLPGFEDEMSTPSSGRSSKILKQKSDPENRLSKSKGRVEAMTHKNDVVRNLQVKTSEPQRSTPRGRERERTSSPAPTRDSKFNTLPRNHKAPEIRVTKTEKPDLMNKTHPVGGRATRTSTLRASKSETKETPRSKTPGPDSLRSSSTGSMSYPRDYRRSVTPTPTSTSQKRAQLSVSRSKSPGPDAMLRNSTENKRPSRTKGPPSSYRNYDTLPRSHRMMEKAPVAREAKTLSTPPRSSNVNDRKYNSLPRPSSAMAHRSPDEPDSGRKSTLSVSRGQPHHKSMQDIRQPPRPKSALGFSSTLSTAPRSNTGRKTVANPSRNSSMQRLTSKARSHSMDNLSIQKQLNETSAATQRNRFFDRLSQPKGSPTRKSHSNLIDEDMLMVQRKGEGRHSVQRSSSAQRPHALGNRQTDHDMTGRRSSTSSEASTHSTHQQQPVTPSDLRLRIKRDDADKRSPKSRTSSTSSTPSPSKDSAIASGLRLSVNMSGTPDSPTSRISCTWGTDSGADELESPTSGQQTHTPKIMNRSSQESHLKAPPKKKVSTEEVIHVVRNPDGRHQWEHTDTSMEQSQEFIEMSPYKDQLSPRSAHSEKPLRSSIRKASSSSESSVMSPTGRNTQVGISQISAGKPMYSSTPNHQDVSLRMPSSRPKQDAGSTSTSSIASSKSSGDTVRRRPNITEEVRSMLFTDDGKARPPSNSSMKSTHPTTTSTPRSSSVRQHPTTPRNEATPRTTHTRSRPLTPKASTTNRMSVVRPRPKTPDARRSTLSRQEKLKSFDGPSPKKGGSTSEPLDRESRMLLEFEREYSENQKILAQSGDEDAKSTHESSDAKGSYVYDYNGRRVRKKSTRSKSPAHLRSKSTPRMERMSSNDSELTNRSYADSIENSEDFEVAMAMSSGIKPSNSSSVRSRSVDDFLEDRGPKPRKDKHESRKSRIPTPVHFNSGRKSATGVPYHDSNLSKSALRSNIEGVGSHEIESNSRRKDQRSHEDTRGNRGQHLQYEKERKQDQWKRNPPQNYHQKENIRPSSATIPRRTYAEEYSLDNQDCFTFGRHGNTKGRSPRKNSDNSVQKTQNDFANSHPQYRHQGDMTAGHVDNRYVQKSPMYSANSNNSNSNPIGQQFDQSGEPIPPARKKGYHRSQLHSSPADLLNANPSTNQTSPHQTELTNQNQAPPNDRYYGPPSREQQRQHGQQLHERNDSGIEAGTDPDSPILASERHLRSVPPHQMRDASHQSRSPYNPPKTQVSSPQHRVMDTPAGKFYYVAPGHHDPRLHTGYDAPRQAQGMTYTSGQLTSPQDLPKNDRAATKQIISKPHRSPKPSFYQQEQVEGYRNQAHGGYQQPSNHSPQYGSQQPYLTAQENERPQISSRSGYNQSPRDYQSAGDSQMQNGTNYPPTSPSSAYSSLPDSRRTSSSTVDDPKPKHQSQHPPIYEQDSLDGASSQRKLFSPESAVTRNSKRRQFNDFFNENRKLRDSLNRLDHLYNKSDEQDSAGNAFQFEYEQHPNDESQGQRPNITHGNAFTLSYSNDQEPPPYSNQGKPQQQSYYPSAIYPRSSKDKNNNADGSNYPNAEGNPFSPDDTPPPPPPRHTAIEKHKFDPQTGRYKQIPNNSGPQANFQFPNGLQRSSKEEYV